MARKSKHGEKRMIERIGVNRSATDKLVNEAYENGFSSADVKGSFNRYLTKIWHQNRQCQVKFYNRQVWIFGHEKTLVTTWPLPSKYHKLEDKVKKNAKKLQDDKESIS